MAAQFCLTVLNMVSACQCSCGGPELAQDVRNCTTVRVPPPVLTISPETLTVKFGQPVQFLCSADGTAIAGLQWTMPSGAAMAGNRRWQADGGRLSLSSAQLTDAGQFVCTVTSIGGRVSKTASLVVLPAEQLQVSISPTSISVRERDRARMVCRSAYGSPRTTLAWSPLPAGSQFNNRTGEFIVQQASKQLHEGRYVCTAYDPLTQQTATATAQLSVTSGVSPLTVKIVPASLTVDAGTTATLRCIVEGGEPKAIYWAAQANNTQKLQRSSARYPGDTMNVVQASINEQGRYACTAVDSEDRRVTSEALLTVREETPIREVKAVEGLDVMLNCEVVRGDPVSMRIEWEKVGTPLPPNSQVRGKTLTISRVRISDEGLYRCTGTDVHGSSSSQSVRIIVGSTPSTPDITGLQTGPYRPGDTLLLRCSSRGRPDPQVTWYGPGNGRDVLSAAQTSTNTLRLNNLRIAQSGTYRCEATNEFGVEATTIRITIAGEPPANVRVIGSGEGAEANIYGARSEARLRCVATSGDGDTMLYSWTKDGAALPSKAVVDGAVLRIPDVHFTDAGSYRCTVTNTYGTGQAAGTINVQGSPVDPPQPNPKTVSARVGVDVRLTCVLPAGADRIEWLRDNKALPASADVDRQSGQTILIRNVQPDDAGVYFCRGVNRQGAGPRAEVVVTVTGEPPTSIRVFGNGEGAERNNYNVGSEATLRCEAASSTGDLTFLWTKDGAARLPSKAVVRDNILRIPNVRPEDVGTYACIARNPFGELRATARINAREAPRPPTPEPATTSSRQGAAVQLRCTLPPGGSRIEWQREGGLQLPSSAVISQPTAEILTIRDVQPEDSGVYLCRAINEVGPSPWVNINVIVTGEPPTSIRVVGNGEGAERNNYNVGSEATLRCEASSSSGDLTFLWTKDGAARLPSKAIVRDNILRIPDVRPEDVGTYACVARNPFGELRATARINAREAPRQPTPEPATTSSRQGATVQLRCTLPPGGVRIEWQREGGLQLPSSAVISQPTAETLTIRDVRPEDSGVYLCRAINEAGPSPWVNINVMVIGEAPSGIRVVGNGGGANRDEYQQGSTAELQCQATVGTQPMSYSWSRAGRPMQAKAIERGSVLRVPYFDLQDDGTYTCTVSNEHGRGSASARLQYAGVPQRPNPTIPEPEQAGGDVRLVCQLPPGADRVEWSREQNKSLPVGHTLSQPTGETLTLTQVRPEDSGTYYCRGVNRHGPGPWVNIAVIVTGGPPTDVRVTGNGEGNLRNTYNVGADVLLRCQATSASGTAGMRYEWTRANGAVPLLAVASTNSLRIPAVRFSDAGTYYCTAINQYGSARGSADIIARGLPEVPVVITTTPDKVQPGVDVRLYCRLPQGAQRVEWRRANDRPLSPRSDLSQPTGETLTLRSVTADDAGVYFCYGINTIGTGPWGNISVSILVPPRAPSIELTPSGGQYEVGSTVQISCYVRDDNGVSYTWQKNREVIPSRFVQGGTGGSASVLRLQNVQLADMGSYTCTARNPYGETSSSVSVSIMSRPTDVRITNVKPSVTVGVDSLEMSCEASGNPPPAIEWYKDGQRIGTGPTLRRSVITSNDVGTYECRATNNLGTGSQTTTVTIECTPPTLPAVSGRRESDDYPVGASLVLTCSSSGLPSPRLSWLKENTRISTTGVLGLTSLSRADSAVYTCIAENSCGRREVRVPVNVFAARPRLVVTGLSSDGRYPVGTTWTLVCRGEGNPAPLVTWQKNNITLGQSSATSATLVLNNIAPEDRGHYSCVGLNVEGKDEKSIFIDVAGESPRRAIITGTSTDERYTVGSDLSLRCDGDGNPRPTVLWTLPGGREVRGESLLLTNLQLNSTGTYVCSVNNAFGIAKAQTYVFVVGVPPRQPLIPGPREIEVSVGQDVPLTCIVASDDPDTDVWWERKSGLPLPAGSIRGPGGLLTVKNIQWLDADDYVCVTRNKYGPSTPSSVKVTIKRVPIFTSINVEKGEEIVEGSGLYRQGSELIVQCSASGVPAPRVRWLRNGGPLPASVENARGRLIFRSVQSSEAGTYTCVAENEGDQKSVTFTVAIQTDVCPRNVTISSDARNGYLQAGRPLTLTCDAVGTPQPTYRWLRVDGRSLPTSTGRRLSLNQATRDDATEYVCIAQNSCGSERASVSLQLAESPTIVSAEPASGQEHFYRRSTDVRLVCRANGRPQPRIVFSRENGQPLPMQARLVGSDTLLIPNVQPGDGGRYLCSVSNDFGRQEASWLITVRSTMQPVIREIITRGQPPYYVGQSVHIICQAENAVANEVRYSWEREDGGFVSGHVGVRNGSLIFNSIKDSDRGTYICVAENDVGRATALTVVIVEGSPFIHLCDLREAQSGCVRAQRYQQDMEIECKTYGKAPITVTWTFEGKTALPQNARVQGTSLLLRQTSSKHTGDYSCKAQNDQGEANAIFHVIIYTLPMKFIQQPHPAFVEYDYEDLSSKDHSIVISVAPKQDSGVLFYLESDDYSEFLSLSLSAGYPELRYGSDDMATVRGTRKVERNKPVTIKVDLIGPRATLTYLDDVQTANLPSVATGLFFSKLYLGGLKLDDAESKQRINRVGTRQGFQGVVTMLIINGRHTDIRDDALEIKGSTDQFDSCTEFPRMSTGPHLCSLGRCIPAYVPMGYFCYCEDGSIGENCTEEGRSTGFSSVQSEEAVKRIYSGASARGGSTNLPSGSRSGSGARIVPWFSGSDPWGNALDLPSSISRRPASGGSISEPSPDGSSWTSVMLRLPSASQPGRGGRSSNVGNASSSASSGSSFSASSSSFSSVSGGSSSSAVRPGEGMVGSRKSDSGMPDDGAVAGDHNGGNVWSVAGLPAGGSSNSRTIGAGSKIEDQSANGGSSLSRATIHSDNSLVESSGAAGTDRGTVLHRWNSETGSSIAVDGGRQTIQEGGTPRRTGQQPQQTASSSATFAGDGYLEMPRSLAATWVTQSQASFDIQTTYPSGVVFLYGPGHDKTTDESEFIALSLVDGKPSFSYKLDKRHSPTTISSSVRVDDGVKHSIEIARVHGNGTLTIDGVHRYYGQARSLFFNPEGDIYLGGVPNAGMLGTSRTYTGSPGFVGCISNVRTSSFSPLKGPIDLASFAKEAKNVREGCQTAG